jgi:hypothetical protein
MPVIEFKIKKGGKIDADYMGFDGDECDMAEEDMKTRLKNLKLDTEIEDRKDDELLQEEEQVE